MHRSIICTLADTTRATNELYALQKSCDCPINNEK